MRGAILLALAAAPLIATADPLSLKGLSPGMAKAQAEEEHTGITKHCSPTKSDPSAEACGYSQRYRSLGSIPALDTLAGADALGWLLIIKDGVVQTVSVRLASQDFDRVTAAIEQRWGAATKREESAVQNRMGASFDQVEVEWRKAGTVLVAKKRSSKVDEMGIFLSTEAQIREGARQRREDQPKRDAKDM